MEKEYHHEVVNRAKQRGDTQKKDVSQQDVKNHRTRNRQRRIKSPPNTYSVLQDHVVQGQEVGDQEKHEGEVVYAGEDDLYNAQVDRDEVVTEATIDTRHNNEEDHHQAVEGDIEVVVVAILTADQVITTKEQLQTDDQGETEANDTH